jgi:quercetin dioxygenase-like cupin family protein
MSDSELAYDISVCLDSAAIAAEQVAIWGSQPVGLQPLRRLADGELRSGIVTLPAGWRCEAAIVPTAHQQFAVLSGRLCYGGYELQAGSFVVVPAGSVMPPLAALEEVCLILIQNEGQDYRDAREADSNAGQESVVLANVWAIEPFTPVIDGVPLHGFERRVLWIDPVNGADTRLLRVPAGFRGAGPSWHPVEEEIYCLEGDIQPDPSRPMRAGSYLWNPARSIHGFDEGTQGGCILLEWHDGLWDLLRA